MTTVKSVARVTRNAIAHRAMIDARTLGVQAARVIARIDAFRIDASHVVGTIGTLQAFRPTADERIPEIVLHAHTSPDTILLSIDRVRAALHALFDRLI